MLILEEFAIKLEHFPFTVEYEYLEMFAMPKIPRNVPELPEFHYIFQDIFTNTI